MHTVFALLCFVVVIHWLIFPYPSGLLHWHCGNLTIAPVPAKQPWWIWINTSCEFIMNDCITTTKQSTTKPCAYFLGYTVWCNNDKCRISVRQWTHKRHSLPHTYGTVMDFFVGIWWNIIILNNVSLYVCRSYQQMIWESDRSKSCLVVILKISLFSGWIKWQDDRQYWDPI